MAIYGHIYMAYVDIDIDIDRGYIDIDMSWRFQATD